MWKKETKKQVITQLEEKLKQVCESVKKTKDLQKMIQAEHVCDSADVGMQEELLIPMEETRHILEGECARIRKLLADLRAGSFNGACIKCGDEIPQERVLTTYTHLCVDCKMYKKMVAREEMPYEQATL